ncbi:MAG: biotin-dependent carboxyltransferase family protein [Psychroserpens sp.]|nr:biotin-dependent carboxyltransferase family protein [Psychroserpens sp.]
MVEVLKTGVFDSIQDLGRADVQQFGVPYAGVMDQYSAMLANSILGNAPNAAVIESTFQGPSLKFQINTLICVSGANANPKINDQPVKLNMALAVKAGDILSFGKLNYGSRIYTAVFGGFQSEVVMNSRSMFTNVTKVSRLQKGDLIPISNVAIDAKTSHSLVKFHQSHFESDDITVLKGPEFESLAQDLKSELFERPFTVASTSNRMAYQVDERLPNDLDSMITSLVLPGTIQLTPSGQLIILMRDCQTTGGYPRILQLTEMAINRLAQKNFGSQIRFKLMN